jgi:L-amino acid N-acyltransferase YncA
LGYSLLTKGIRKLGEFTAVKKVVGYVQEQNVASIKAFQRSGFYMQADSTHSASFKFTRSFTSV